MDTSNTIAKVEITFIKDNSGIIKNFSLDDSQIIANTLKPKGIPNKPPMIIKAKLCVINSFVNESVLKPKTLRVPMSRSISKKLSNPKL